LIAALTIIAVLASRGTEWARMQASTNAQSENNKKQQND
jgi:hypothetical protein